MEMQENSTVEMSAMSGVYDMKRFMGATHFLPVRAKLIVIRTSTRHH